MECRDARPLIARLDLLSRPERERLDLHLGACAACRDEVDDPVAVALAAFALPPAKPPPELLRNVLLRLPAASPIEIAARQQRVRRAVIGISTITLGLLAALALAGIILLQATSLRAADLVRGIGLPLALAAKAVLAAAGQPWIFLLVAGAVLAAAVLLARLMPGVVRRPASAARPALAGGALLVLLLLANAAALRGDVGTLAAPIDVDGRVAGNVTSVAGDITVRGEVMGDVISLAGRVLLDDGARVHGSVMAGSSAVQQGGARVDQVLLGGVGPLPGLAQVTGVGTGVGTSSRAAAGIAGMLAAFVTLILAAFLVVVWPQRPAEASVYLARFPGRAVAFGALATLALLALALGGAVLLAATVAGVLLVPVLLLLLHLPYVAGVAAVGQALGRVLTGHSTAAGAIWGIAAQLILVIAIGLLIPTAGLLVFYVLGSIGLGGTLLVLGAGALDT